MILSERYERDVKKIKPKEEAELPECSAPISGDRCDYCGTQFIDCTTIRMDKPFYLKFVPMEEYDYQQGVFGG